MARTSTSPPVVAVPAPQTDTQVSIKNTTTSNAVTGASLVSSQPRQEQEASGRIKNERTVVAVSTARRGRGSVIVGGGSSGVGKSGLGESFGRSAAGQRVRIAAISAEDAAHGALASDPVARVDPRLAYRWVGEYRLGGCVQDVYGAMAAMWGGMPVVLRGGKEGNEVGGLGGFDGVAGAMDGEVVVMVSAAGVHRFMEFDVGKNDARGPYFVREFETQMVGMASVRAFVECARSWQKQRVYLSLRVGDHCQGTRVEEVNEKKEGLWSLLERVVNWEVVEGVMASQRLGVVKEGMRLEMGTRNGVLPARYSTQDVLMVQVHGRRRVTLVSPRWAFGGMYPYPTHHPYDGMAMASLEEVNEEDWPGMKDVELERAILGPGDMLFVPAYWFVHVHELEEETVCVRVPLAQGRGSSSAPPAKSREDASSSSSFRRRPPARDATLVRVSRVLEDRVAQTVGVSEVKRWMRIMSQNAEAKHMDLSTVKGYRCARMTQEVRDDLECSGLSVETALAQIIDRRLEPTPWLNQHFREPLLLTDTPKVYQDTRTEEERKYPTLFRKKLERDGWKVDKTVSTVPIPGVNMPQDADYRLI